MRPEALAETAVAAVVRAKQAHPEATGGPEVGIRAAEDKAESGTHILVSLQTTKAKLSVMM